MSSRAAKLYLVTLGQGKQGISIVGQDEDGNPVYSTGERAIAERNILRYYFAFNAFFHSNPELEQEVMNKRMNSWFDQTEQYEQLYEVDREEYLADKQKEYNNQVVLQRLENAADENFVDRQLEE